MKDEEYGQAHTRLPLLFSLFYYFDNSDELPTTVD